MTDKTADPAPAPRRVDRRQRGRTVACRPSAEQLAEIERRADAAALSPGGYVLRAALSGSGLSPRRRAPAADAATLDALRDLARAVGAVGNNVNQLARAVHLGQLADGASVGPALAAEVQALAADIRATLRVCAGMGE